MRKERRNRIGNRAGLFFCLSAALLFLTACAGGKDGISRQPDTEQGETLAQGESRIKPTAAPKPYESESGAQYYFKAGERYLSVYNGEEFEDLYVKGVNIGLGKPGYFPGEAAITKEEYARWFQEIGEMNANCIRVYTLQTPAFYEAFYEYNETAQKPLYLFQGTWYDETRMVETLDVYDEELQEYLYQDMRNLVDIIHGNCEVGEAPGKASGVYRYDISPYVIGWILGIESDAELVMQTDEKHKEISSYEGDYLRAEDLEAFEVFWAETGDYIVSYEMEQYHMQRPVSYSNWPTADMLEHPSETMGEEMSVDLNVEDIQTTAAFECGLFASYHIYPYYPNFLYTQLEYQEYVDEEGRVNTYRPYLEELIARHHMPVVVAEFGVPASRGITHSNPYTGYDQGNLTEDEQGEVLVSLMEDIHDTGYAGGLIFTWQDEWFKRTWSTEAYTTVDRRAYWCDVMTCEQHFGLLEFVPGEEGPVVVLDGDKSEWDETDVLLDTDGMRLSMKYDCAYLYLMIEKADADYDTQKLIVPFDVTPNSGSLSYETYRFDRPADFVLSLNGRDDSKLLVQSYYDRYLHDYDKYDDTIAVSAELTQPDSGVFQPIYYFLERELILPDRPVVYPVKKFEGGRLVFGTSDYDSPDYDSLADFCYEGDVMEIRVPWLMLNFRDPSAREIEDDFWANGYLSGMKITSIWVGIAQKSVADVKMAEYHWRGWSYYPYFERLRKGYYDVQEQFADMGTLP